MAERLSDALMELAAKTRSMEDKLAAARQESKEKLDQRIDETKAELAVKKESFVNKTEALGTDLHSGMDAFKSSMKQRIEYIKSDIAKARHQFQEKMGETKHKWDVSSAERHYEKATDYALSCVEWAYIALSEVESAALEALDAKLKLEEVKERHT